MSEGNTFTGFQITKLDRRHVPHARGEIRCFVCLRNERLRLPHFLDHHRRLGVDRFFLIDNRSNDGSREFLLEQDDCHIFDCGSNYFAENVTPPSWTNCHLNLFGDGHWTLTVDPDELLAYPHYEVVELRRLCSFLEKEGSDALLCPLLDMYGKGPIRKIGYEVGQAFLEACPYFDPVPGWTKSLDGKYQPDQIFGGVRERVFWRGKYKESLPPCLSKVPLVKWRRGMRYLASTHLISHAKLSKLHGALLHFKFLTGFVETMTTTVQSNSDVAEKGLGERAAYLDALRRDPDLILWAPSSARYEGSAQIVALELMRSSPEYERFSRSN